MQPFTSMLMSFTTRTSRSPSLQIYSSITTLLYTVRNSIYLSSALKTDVYPSVPVLNYVKSLTPTQRRLHHDGACAGLMVRPSTVNVLVSKQTQTITGEFPEPFCGTAPGSEPHFILAPVRPNKSSGILNLICIMTAMYLSSV